MGCEDSGQRWRVAQVPRALSEHQGTSCHPSPARAPLLVVWGQHGSLTCGPELCGQFGVTGSGAQSVRGQGNCPGRWPGGGRGARCLPGGTHALACPQGMPGKDGRDGVPGLDGEKVSAGLAACQGGGTLQRVQPPGPQHPPPLNLPQGEAGRNGAPGEKGPNGMPVSVWAPQGRGLCPGWSQDGGLSCGALTGLVPGAQRIGAPCPSGSASGPCAESLPLSCRVSPEEQGPRVRRESW